jgi:hypothetical protein
MLRKIVLLTFIALSLTIVGQRNVTDSIIGTPWVGVHYGGNWTGGDLANRYGYLNHAGFMAGYKTNKNVYLGMEANFIFGNDLDTSFNHIFDHLLDSYGNITDVNGDIAKVLVYSRGMHVNLSIGKVIPVLSSNKNSGIFIHGGVGLLLHRLRIETQDQVIPQLELDYKKGYDRLSIGPNLHQFVGYAFLADGGYYNFYGGFYCQQGFTTNQRTINFDQPDVPVSQKTMFDLQYGFRLGWFIPFYKREVKDYYFD